MDGAGAGGAARERRKQLTAAEAVNHKRQLAQMVERELALTGADSVTDFDDALQMVLVETAFGRYPKHLLDVYTGKVVGRQERGDVVKSWQLCAVVRTAVSSLLLLFWEYGTWSGCGAVAKIWI